MRNKILLVLFALSIIACKNNTQTKEETTSETQDIAYQSIGKKILAEGALREGDMTKVYFSMKQGDTIQSKMIAKVDEVCQAKGCWMTLNLQNGKQVMVKFKDYGFFMPKDIAGKEVIINGKAFVDEMSVDEQKHYAQDAGKSAEEVEAIKTPKRTYSFEADGVLLKE